MSEPDFDRRLGASVSRYRRAANLSQSDLAARLTEHGLPFQQQTVLKVEKGTRPLRAAELHAIAELLGVSMDEIVGFTSDSSRAQALAERSAVEVELSALRAEAAALHVQIEAAERRRAEAHHRLASIFEDEGRPDMALGVLRAIGEGPADA